MVLGYLLTGLALALTVIANVFFAFARRQGEVWVVRGKQAVTAATAAIVGAAGYLVYLIATHQFQVSYVAEYSARRSSAWYLLAAFWGGQEGSILLWTFMGAILGWTLSRKSGDKTARVWPIFGIIQVYLLSLLLFKSPFALGEGPVPADGRGLNPLLENMWMVIHPPMLFLGFAALMPVFAWCLYGLLFRDWHGWAKAVFPWALFAFATLGFGLSLGGFWAYETLGWGGFWAWDPVENSSLVPWLFITALLHGLPIQLKNGGYRVSNLVLGFLPFAFMFYGTFLTRSGVLTDFSVHSFSSLGQDGFYLLLGGLLTSVLVPVGLIIGRFRSIPKVGAFQRILTREFGYFLGSALLGLIGLIVAVGMSAPLITKIWMEKGAAAQQSFYNTAAYPLGILMLVGMAVTPYLAWKSSDDGELGKRLLPPYIATLLLTMVMTALAFTLGIRKPFMVLLFAASIFTAASNLLLILPRLKHAESRKSVGGFVAHIGAGLTLAGVACLVAFTQNAERVMLTKDQPVEKLGYTFIYRGQTSHAYDRERNHIRVEVRRGKYTWDAFPRYYIAPWDNRDTVFANPPAILPSVYNINSPIDLLRCLPWNTPFPWGDLYVSLNTEPQSPPMLSKNPNQGFTLAAGEEKTIGEYTFRFRALKFDEAAQKAQNSRDELNKLPQIFVMATIDVTYRGRTETVTPRLRLERTGAIYSLPVPIPGREGRPVVLKLEPPREEEQGASREITLRTLGAEDPFETVFVDVSTKPMIGLVWIGALLYTAGGLIAYRRRAVELRLFGTSEPSSPESHPASVTPPGKGKGKTGTKARPVSARG
ncbi:MAG: cytochrome c biogenesis protein CcsA [Capsulimonadales bacterium]|nr:cytochrome c biogenesis protein CcsA [Capsulimonadales bacterium]